MSKLLLVGDLHISPWSSFNKDEVYDGRVYPSRVVDAFRVMERANKIAQEHDAQIIQMGDLFNDRYTLDVMIAQKTKELIKDWTVLRGNHDTYDDHGKVSSLSLICSAYMNVPHTMIYCNDTNVFFLPYSDNPYKQLTELASKAEASWKKHNIVIAHLAPDGAKLSGTELINDKCKVDSKLLEQFDACFTGHIHIPQEIGKWHIVGAALQQNFGETNFKPTFTLVTINKEVEIQRIPTHAPSFHNYNIQTYDELEKNLIVFPLANKYVKVKTTHKLAREHDLAKILSAARGYILEITDSDKPIEIEKPILDLNSLVRQYARTGLQRNVGMDIIKSLGNTRGKGGRIRLHGVTARNFLSIKHKHMVFRDIDVTQLTGDNGTGKSAIIEAVWWALTGQLIRRKVKSSRVIRDGANFCKVSIRFSLDNKRYELARTRKGSKTVIGLVIDGKAVKLHGSYPKRCKRILAILGLDISLLFQTCFLTPTTLPFSQLTDNEQKTMLVDSLIGDRVFSLAKKEARLQFNKHLKMKAASDSRLKELEKNIAELEVLKKHEEDDYWHKNREYKVQLKKYKKATKEKDKLKQKILGLEEKNRAYSKWADKYSKLETDAGTKITFLKMDIEAKGKKCPACGVTILHDKVKSKKKVEYWKQKMKALEKDWQSYYQKRKKYSNKHKRVGEVLYNVREHLEELHEVDKPVKPSFAAKNRFTKLMKEKKHRFNKLEAKRKSLNNLVGAYEFWEKAFGDKGIRLQVLEASLGYINNTLATGLPMIGDLEAELVLDENDRLQLKVESPAGAKYYAECSYGQQARVDLIIMEALSELARAYSVSTLDTVFLDERFPYIDSKGQTSLIQQIKKSKRKYVIVTRDPSVRSMVDRVIEVKLKNGMSIYHG